MMIMMMRMMTMILMLIIKIIRIVMIITLTITICSSICHSGHGVPSYCQGPNLAGQGQALDNMQLYHRWVHSSYPIFTFLCCHRVMSNTYKAERQLKERETKWRAGVPGIPFAHRTSIQGNPMRSGDWKSS